MPELLLAQSPIIFQLGSLCVQDFGILLEKLERSQIYTTKFFRKKIISKWELLSIFRRMQRKNLIKVWDTSEMFHPRKVSQILIDV